MMLKKQVVRLMLVLTALLWSSNVFAQTWDDTFEPGAIHSYMSPEGHKFLVVAAGEASESTQAAATSLEAALRSGPATLVMNDEALGSLVGLDDAAIVEKAGALPVERIAIVRVFAGATDDQETVVVTVHDKVGKNLWALSGTRGVAIAARTGGLGAISGIEVHTGAAESVRDTVRSSSQDREAARNSYAERFLWSQDLVGVNQYGGVLFERPTIYKGKYKEKLTPEEFYLEVGRPDLAEELASNQTRGTIGIIVGSVGVLGLTGGGTWMLMEALLSGTGGEYDPDTGETITEDANYLGPGVVMGASVVAIVAAAFISPDQMQPVSQSEALRLADQHNQKLKKELGLDDDYSIIPDPSDTESMNFSYGLSPTFGGVHGAIRVDF